MRTNAGKIERRLIGAFSFFIFVVWLIACFTDVNHPPGARFVRLATFGFVILVGFLEFKKPWFGFYAFLLIWPQHLMLRELLSKFINPVWIAMPSYSGGFFACVLTLAYQLRTAGRRSVPRPLGSGPHASGAYGWLDAVRVCLWVLAANWILSVIVFYIRYSGHPQGWVIESIQIRTLFGPSLCSALKPAISALNYVPSFLLGLILLNDLAHPRCHPVDGSMAGAYEIPIQKMLVCFALGGLVVAVEVMLYFCIGWYGGFDGSPPGGPFDGRNLSMPVLVVTAWVFGILAVKFKTWILRGMTAVAALFCIALVLMSGSRNAALMVLILPWLLLFIRPTLFRSGLAIVLLAIVISAALWLPLPRSDSVSSYGLQRLIGSAEDFRKGAWADFMARRHVIYGDALEIAKNYPLAGAGPGTFVMLTQPKAHYNSLTRIYGYAPMHAHSVPLQLLCELGVLGLLSWAFIWLALPAWAMLRWSCGRGMAVVLLLVGIGNQLDVVWYLHGMTTICVLFVVWTMREMLLSPLIVMGVENNQEPRSLNS